MIKVGQYVILSEGGLSYFNVPDAPQNAARRKWIGRVGQVTHRTKQGWLRVHWQGNGGVSEPIPEKWLSPVETKQAA